MARTDSEVSFPENFKFSSLVLRALFIFGKRSVRFVNGRDGLLKSFRDSLQADHSVNFISIFHHLFI